MTDNRGATTSVTNDIDVIDPPPNVLPTAAFGTGVIAKTATFTSTSTDSDGTIVSSAWDFGDTTTGTGATTSHTYAAAGTYNVTLTVTDNRSGTNSVTHPVTITNYYASDTFERTVANGLGTADNGGAWTAVGNRFGVLRLGRTRPDRRCGQQHARRVPDERAPDRHRLHE